MRREEQEMCLPEVDAMYLQEGARTSALEFAGFSSSL